jgi:hypothetical protein
MKKLLMIVIFGLLIINNSNADIIKLNNCKYIGKSENRNYTTNISIDTINKTLELSSEKGKKNYTVNHNSTDNSYSTPSMILWETESLRHKYDFYPDKNQYIWSYYAKKMFKNEFQLKQQDLWQCNKFQIIAQKKNVTTNTTADNSIEFNIKQKKEQCEAIGFKPETEKFADCVLRLVELDVKQQTQNQIASAQNSGNDALVKQLERQNNLQSSQALINLGQQLMNPKQYNSNIYMPQTRRCTVSGFGVTSVVRCY